MGWDDQLESELQRFKCTGFREGFAGRTMEALNEAIRSGRPYKGPGVDSCIVSCFFRVSTSALGLLGVLLVLTFGLSQNQAEPEFTQGSQIEEPTLEEWLETLGDEMMAGIL